MSRAQRIETIFGKFNTDNLRENVFRINPGGAFSLIHCALFYSPAVICDISVEKFSDHLYFSVT